MEDVCDFCKIFIATVQREVIPNLCSLSAPIDTSLMASARVYGRS